MTVELVDGAPSRFGGRVKLIQTVRDGRDVVTSMHPTRQENGFWISPERWVADVSAGLPYDRHPRVCVVRYEDLVMDYGKTIRRICNFLQEVCVPEVLNWHAHATVRRHWFGRVPNWVLSNAA